MTKTREVYSEPQNATANKNITHISEFGEKHDTECDKTTYIYKYMYI